MNNEPSIIWWENITGSFRLASAIKSATQDGFCVILRHPGFVPWRDSLRDIVGESAIMLSVEHAVSKENVIPLLLDELSPKYRNNCPTGYNNQINYIKSQNVFQSNTVWIFVSNGVIPDGIVRFVSDYRGNDFEKYGSFVVSISENIQIPTVSEMVKVLKYQDYVGFGSLRLFSSIIAESLSHIPEKLKSYAAAVSASLCNPDAELIPKLMGKTDFEVDDLSTVLQQMWTTGDFLDIDRTACAASKWEHPFSLLKANNHFQIKKRIWRAQLQTVFPEIEIERVEIIDSFEASIQAAIQGQFWDKKKKCHRNVLDAIPYSVNSLYDLEIGTLAFLLTIYKDEEQTEKVWYLPDKTARDRINLLKDCRNNLAHLAICTANQVSALLNYR